MSDSNETPKTKQCPFCGETILEVARKCRYCKEMLDGETSTSAPRVHQSPPPPPPVNPMPQRPMYSTPQPPVYSIPQPPLPPMAPQGEYVPHPEQKMRVVPTYKPKSFLTFRNWLVFGTFLLFACTATIFGLMIALSVMEPGYYSYYYEEYYRNYDYEACALTLVIFILATSVLSLIFTPVFLVFHYRCWNIIQDGYAQTSPGMAVGLMFIPIFNLFWAFISIYGLTSDLNNYLRRYGINAKPCAHGLAMTMCILSILFPYIVPFLAIFYLVSVSRVAAAIQKAKMAQIS